jgi:adenylate cyclase
MRRAFVTTASITDARKTSLPIDSKVPWEWEEKPSRGFFFESFVFGPWARTAEERVTLTIVAFTCLCNIGWVASYLLCGLWRSSAAAAVYFALSLANAFLLRTYSSTLFLHAQGALVFLCAGAVHWLGGGFAPTRGVIMWTVLAPLLDVLTNTVPSFKALGLWIASMIGLYTFGLGSPFVDTPEVAPEVFWLLNLLTPLVLSVGVVGMLNRQLQIEKERYRALLCNVMPPIVANRVLANPALQVAHEFSQASVVFIDVVHFTQWAQEVDASRLVSVLSDLFTLFDGLALRNGVEKIKTIGDCFLGAVGVPEQTTGALCASRISRCALDCVAALPEFNARHGTHLAVRVGIATGCLVGGVIGRTRIQFDIWGNCVNLASRVEGSSDTNRVSVCEKTRHLIGDQFECEDRGFVPLKGLGPTRLYYLVN